MSPPLNLAGQRFGRLVAIERTAERRHRSHVWLAACDCGTEIKVMSSVLASGQTRSCGCLQRDIAKAAGDRTRTHGMSKTSTYHIWSSMWDRCTKPHRRDYPNYGGRGISVCDRWECFDNFLADMGPRPDGMSLDRRDNDKGYTPENCRWATTKEQARNTSASRFIEFDGRRMCLVEWAEQVGIKPVTLNSRLRNGWTVEKALTTPVDRRFSHAA